MKRNRVLFVIAILFVLTITGCYKQKVVESVTVTYKLNGEVFETHEIKQGDLATNIEVESVVNKVFGGWTYNGEQFDFTQAVNKNIILNGKYIDVCDYSGHTEIIDKGYGATCTTSGLSDGSHCSVCNKVLVKQERIDALGHTIAIDEAIESTCTTTGLTEGKHCSVCNEVLLQQFETTKKSHEYGNATCIKPSSCINCDEPKDQKLGEHSVIEANYEHGAYCSLCNEVYGEKLLYNVVDLEYTISYENEILTTEEYNNIKENLVVSGILEDGTKVEILLDDLEVYYEIIINEETKEKNPYIKLKYNDFEKVTNKKYYSVFNELELDLEQISNVATSRLVVKEDLVQITFYRDELTNYIKENFGLTIENYFIENGWQENVYKWDTDMGPTMSINYSKDDITFYFVDGFVNDIDDAIVFFISK